MAQTRSLDPRLRPEVPVEAFTPAWRAVTGLLRAWSSSNLLLILAAVLLADDPPITPRVLFVSTAVLAALPAAAARLASAAFAGACTFDRDRLVVRRRDRVLSLALAEISEVRVWSVPLPASGLTLMTEAGPVPWRLAARVPGALVEALAEQGVERSCLPARDWRIAYADARGAMGRSRSIAWLLGVGLFALLPTAILFNAHQHIAFGGLFGEYYLLGAAAWLRTLAVYWLATAVYLVLYKAALRVPLEVACLVVAIAAPREGAAERARALAERAGTLAYYAGVPILLGVRFLA